MRTRSSSTAQAFSTAIERAIDLSQTRRSGRLISTAELAFQTMVHSGMWRVPPRPAGTRRRLDRGCAQNVAGEGQRTSREGTDRPLLPRLGLQVPRPCAELRPSVPVRGFGEAQHYARTSFDVLGLTGGPRVTTTKRSAGSEGVWVSSKELDDPDHQADIYANAIPPAVALGEFDEARRYTNDQLELTRTLSPHHRLHGLLVRSMELEELSWETGPVFPGAASGSRGGQVAATWRRRAYETSDPYSSVPSQDAYEGDEQESWRLEEAGLIGFTKCRGTERSSAPLGSSSRFTGATRSTWRRTLAAPPCAVRRGSSSARSRRHFNALAALGEGRADGGRGGTSTSCRGELPRAVRAACPRPGAQRLGPGRARGCDVRGHGPLLACRPHARPAL